jgi:hypothetical protein
VIAVRRVPGATLSERGEPQPVTRAVVVRIKAESFKVFMGSSICTLRQIVSKDKSLYNQFMTREKPTSLSLRLGAKISKLRRSKRLTQGRVEELTGLPAGYLSRIEHGTILPGLEVLASISKVLEISLPRLVTGITEDEPL